LPVSLNKKIIVSVISDVVTDQRVQKICNTFIKIGYDVLLIGRKGSNSALLMEFPYKVILLQSPFRRGPLMYLFFNIQLFFFLLFRSADVYWANDLDTLLPNFINAAIKNKKLVYDSHEYFTQSVYKRSSRRVWEFLEKMLFPKLKNIITVNNSIKSAYEEKYNVTVTAVRNVPHKINGIFNDENLIFASGNKILLMQGMGINEHRGAEEAVLTMQFLPDDFNLYFIGSGTVLEKLKEMVQALNLSSKVTFIDPMSYDQMMQVTRRCFLGLIFEKIDYSDQHLFALPNKLFDYIQAGVPVLSSKAVEIEFIIKKYQVGDFISDFDPHHIAEKIISIEKDVVRYNLWKEHTALAATELNWGNEEKILINFMQHLR
jgi:glycosyltransferase involved in cell wall biosynthesis